MKTKHIDNGRNRKKHEYKDDADIFREESPRAIRRRKVLPKYLFWILTAVAAFIVAAAVYVTVFGV